jgi:tight adherence protein C
VRVGPLATLFGAGTAGLLAMAIAVRLDPSVARALEPLRKPGSPAERNWEAFLTRLGRTSWAAWSRDALERRFLLVPISWSLEQVLGLKLALALSALALTVSAIPVVPGAALLALPVAAAAFRGPDFVLARMARRRSLAIAGQAADFAEVLLATTQAGLTPPVAFRRSADAMAGPLGDELAVVTRQIGLGVPWREAVETFGARTEEPGIRRLISALVRTQRLGTSVASPLRAVAEDLRGERRAQAEERARRAPVKMLFPLVFLILPAFLLLTVGPVVLATIRSLR